MEAQLDEYEIEGPSKPEFLMDLCEFQMASTLYNALCENACSEHASRMSAMENSTKNASEMLGNLTLLYNRCVDDTGFYSLSKPYSSLVSQT